MAADVSMLIKDNNTKSGLITRDFLGGCFGIDSKELDLDLHVPNGWEKRLDLKSGKVYIQRSNPANSASEHKKMAKEISTKPQDLNVFQQSSSSSSNTKPTLGLLEQPSLDLKLIPNNQPSNYSSVCTLDKVKSALDRAERASPTSSSSTSSSSSSKKRWMMMPTTVRSSSKSSPSPSNSLSLSIGEEERESSRLSNSLPSDNQNKGLLVAAACPACLLYVLISKNDPKCPKCNSVVHLPTMNKKPKIDLNMSM
ncbi:putative protein TPRXL [Chenopodium quinoa]|uniref:putative protein TPRXL n=1 Tax=Chenopodium quinoa TaxID=63459 RepID=UPI000B78B1D3|nr:putative protein TPRXL [Chenopodium quinoa]